MAVRGVDLFGDALAEVVGRHLVFCKPDQQIETQCIGENVEFDCFFRAGIGQLRFACKLNLIIQSLDEIVQFGNKLLLQIFKSKARQDITITMHRLMLLLFVPVRKNNKLFNNDIIVRWAISLKVR